MKKRRKATEGITIPVPVVRPLGTALDKPEYVQEVWDVFVKPHQDAGELPSVEMRMLMAILRAVYVGLSPATSPGEGAKGTERHV